MYYTTTYNSPIAPILLASNGQNLVGAWFEGQKYYGSNIISNAEIKNDLPVFDLARNWLDGYFNGEKPDISLLPLAPVGSDFRMKVWKVLCDIPYGEYITYGDIAKKLNINCSQAIGGAVGHNPISVIIPCHRVVGSNGSLTGYAGGIDKKIYLLELEGANMSLLFTPNR